MVFSGSFFDVVCLQVIKPSENPNSRPSYGDQVTLKTAGTLEDGSVVDKHDSVTFTLGDGDVIQGDLFHSQVADYKRKYWSSFNTYLEFEV